MQVVLKRRKAFQRIFICVLFLGAAAFAYLLEGRDMLDGKLQRVTMPAIESFLWSAAAEYSR